MPMETEYLTASKVAGLIWNIENPISKHAERRKAEVMAYLLKPQQNDSILDVGCGDGCQLSYVSGRAQDIVGIDISREKLKEARKRVKSAEYVCAHCENLPFRHQVFDKEVMCLELLEHLPNPVETPREIERVLRNNGTLLVLVPYRERITFTPRIHCDKLTPLWGAYAQL